MTLLHKTLAALWALGTVAGGSAAAAPTRAEPTPSLSAGKRPPVAWQLQLHHDTLWRSDAAYRTFSHEERASAVGVSASRQVVRRGPLQLALGAGWRRENVQNRGDVSRAALTVNAWHALALVRYQLRWWLVPQLMVGLGGSQGHVTIGGANGATYRGDRWAPSAEAGAGLVLRTRPIWLGGGARAPRLIPTFTVQGGAHLGSAMAFQLTGNGPTQTDDDIAVRGVNAGDLARNHPYLRVGLGLEF